jgi:pimeloyl-ACP methyl ester carboxylesterase
MPRLQARRFVSPLAVAVLLWAAPVLAAAHIPLPADLSGTLNGVEYRIRVPANWNGTLLVWGHGAGTWSIEVAPPTVPSTSPTLEEQLLARGYALAGSLYQGSTKEALQQTLALTNFFKGAVGNPQRVIVWGISWGGSVSLDLIEAHPGIYDGAIPIAPVAAGGPRDADFELRYGLAYAAAFGWPSDWWGPIEDLRDDVCGNEATLIHPVFQWASPGNYGQWEFIRLVMELPWSVWWEVEQWAGLPGWAMDGWKATAGRACKERDYGGPVAQNIGDVYDLTPEEKAYLSSLGVNAEPLLAWMNERTSIAASHPARTHSEHYSPSGDLRRPVVTMHGIFDAMLPVSHQAAYRALVDAAGAGDKLVQAYVPTGHATFSAEQYLATLAAMEHWLDTGIQPDASFFPESVGFDNGYVPPDWPY